MLHMSVCVASNHHVYVEQFCEKSTNDRIPEATCFAFKLSDQSIGDEETLLPNL